MNATQIQQKIYNLDADLLIARKENPERVNIIRQELKLLVQELEALRRA